MSENPVRTRCGGAAVAGEVWETTTECGVRRTFWKCTHIDKRILSWRRENKIYRVNSTMEVVSDEHPDLYRTDLYCSVTLFKVFTRGYDTGADENTSDTPGHHAAIIAQAVNEANEVWSEKLGIDPKPIDQTVDDDLEIFCPICEQEADREGVCDHCAARLGEYGFHTYDKYTEMLDRVMVAEAKAIKLESRLETVAEIAGKPV